MRSINRPARHVAVTGIALLMSIVPTPGFVTLYGVFYGLGFPIQTGQAKHSDSWHIEIWPWLLLLSVLVWYAVLMTALFLRDRWKSRASRK